MINYFNDTAVHFLKIDDTELGREFAWAKELGLPEGKFSVADYVHLRNAASITHGDIFAINATKSPLELEFLERCAREGDELLSGSGRIFIAPWVDLREEPAKFEKELRRLGEIHTVVSVRDIAQGEGADFFDAPNVLENCTQLKQAEMPMEALVFSGQLHSFHRLMTKLADISGPPLKVNINHGGKPFDETENRGLPGGFEEWKNVMQQIGGDFSNVWCKLSLGLNEVKRLVTQNEYRKAIAVMCDAFGRDRLLCGLNYPVTPHYKMDPAYGHGDGPFTMQGSLRVIEDGLEFKGYSVEQIQRICYDNAKIFYNLNA